MSPMTICITSVLSIFVYVVSSLNTSDPIHFAHSLYLALVNVPEHRVGAQ